MIERYLIEVALSANYIHKDLNQHSFRVILVQLLYRVAHLDLDWVLYFIFGIPPSCQAVQPHLPNVPQPTQKRAKSKSTQPRSATSWATVYFKIVSTVLRDEKDGRRSPGVVALHHDVRVVGRGQEDE